MAREREDWVQKYPYWTEAEWKRTQEVFQGKFWIGKKDLSVPEEIILDLGWNEDIPVILSKEHLPPLNWLSPEIVAHLEVSTRSRMAQCGLNVNEKETQILLALGLSDERKQALESGKSFILRVPVENSSGRKIIIPTGCGLFRFYFHWGAEWVVKDRLVNLLETQQGIKINGRKGKDWDYFINSYGEIVALKLTLDPNSWKFWPKEASNQAFIVPTGQDYRSEIDKDLKPFLPDSPPTGTVLWVCESQAVVTIEDKNINTTLPGGILTRKISNRTAFFVPHMSSLLVAGGETNWRLRFEILCGAEDRPTKVNLMVYRNKNN